MMPALGLAAQCLGSAYVGCVGLVLELKRAVAGAELRPTT